MPEGNKRKAAKDEIPIMKMEIDDIAAVYHLGEELFTSETFPILYRTWDPYEVTDYFTSDPEYCLVAEKEGKVVGFILGTTIEKEGTAWKKYGYLSWMGVDKAFQRTNVGQRLYLRLEDRMREDGVRMVIADTEGDNDRAIAFFNAMGFSSRSEHVWLAKTLKRPARKKGAREGRPTNAGARRLEKAQLVKRAAIPGLSPSRRRASHRGGKKSISDSIVNA